MIDYDQASSLRSFVLPGFGYAELKVRITACSPSLPIGVVEVTNQLLSRLVGEADYDKPVKIMVDKEDSQKNILKSGELSGIVLGKVLEEVVTQNAADTLEEPNVDIVVSEDFVDVRAGTADL